MADSRQSLKEFFTLEHRRCDARWAEIEAAVQAGDVKTQQQKWRIFQAEMLRHLRMEIHPRRRCR